MKLPDSCQFLLGLLIGGVLLHLSAPAMAEKPADALHACGGFPKQGGGPYDYRRMRGTEKLGIIESNHFTPNVELLLSGNTTAFVGGELGFTLRAVPNHHRAMLAIIRLGEKLSTTKPKGSEFTIECWLDRAVRFAPDDNVARLIFASWLGKNGRVTTAVEQVKHVTNLAGDNPLTHYNAGMVYLEMKQYDLAVEQANKAAVLGYERPELRDGLRSAGKWTEPVAAVPASAATGSADASSAATK